MVVVVAVEGILVRRESTEGGEMRVAGGGGDDDDDAMAFGVVNLLGMDGRSLWEDAITSSSTGYT